MFEIKGISILVNEVQVLQELRRQVYEKTGKEILRKIKPSGNNIMICCPSHHDGQERNPSCGISTVRVGNKPPGTVHCFACGYVDSLEGMVGKCFGMDTNYGIKWLLDNFISDENYKRQLDIPSFDRSSTLIKQQYITEEELSKYRFYHPYMYQRKLTNEIIEKFDVGYQKDFVFQENWRPVEVLTFPVRDKNGNCLFVSRRSIYGKTFFLPKDLQQKPVYGIYELPSNCEEVIICESVINALTCWVYGKPALALFGTGSNFQYSVLNNLSARKFILALDADSAGEKGTAKLKYYLKDKLLSKYVIPTGKDINDLSYEQFMNLPQIFI